MELHTRLRKLPFCHGFETLMLDTLVSLAEQIELSPQSYLTRQYHPADYFYLLGEGEVQFFLRLEGKPEALLVGNSDRPWTPLGWSGFLPGGRYAVTTRCEGYCTVLRWESAVLQNLIVKQADFGKRFLSFVLEQAVVLLHQARGFLQDGATQDARQPAIDPLESLANSAHTPVSALDALHAAAFFEDLPLACIEQLAAQAEVQHFQAGQHIYAQGEAAEQFAILGNGRVALSFQYSQQSDKKSIKFRHLSEIGQCVAWSALFSQPLHTVTATALSDSYLYWIPRRAFDTLAAQQPELGVLFMQRLLWLMNHHLRTIRVRIIALRCEQEISAIANLIEQHSPQLPIQSALYKIPHLLASPVTGSDALNCLEHLKAQGNGLEKTIARQSFDVLAGIRMEIGFQHALQTVYDTVVNAPAEWSAETVRKASDQAFYQAFQSVRYKITGEELLPAKPGHIFILNHLISHPYNALPNHFELALDTNFVSAMLLHPRYNNGDLRVVRKGRGEEFGHRAYYDRLDHLYVYTAESDQLGGEAEAKQRRTAFFEAAREAILQGKNLIICPEGTSNWSHESPSEFKLGAFRLAARIQPEPLIVPVVVANFDRRIKDTVLTASVKPPFRISEQVDVEDYAALTAFLAELRQTYRGYVQAAAQTI